VTCSKDILSCHVAIGDGTVASVGSIFGSALHATVGCSGPVVGWSAPQQGTEQSNWIVDSGATAHCTGNRALLSRYRSPPPGATVRFAVGPRFPVVGVGDAIITTPKGQIQLTDVWHVPGAHHNLLSVKRGVRSGFRFYLLEHGCRIYHDGKYKCTAPEVHGLCILQGTVPISVAIVSNRNVEAMVSVSAQVWHSRFAHLGYGNLSKLVSKGMVTGIHVNASAFESAAKQNCNTCKVPTQVRQPCPQSQHVSTRTLQSAPTLQGPYQRGTPGQVFSHNVR